MSYQTVLFDFDGTLCDTGEGVLKSAKYALDAFGIPAPGWEELRFFVGPPLIDSFQRYEGVGPEEAACLVEKYRERYRETGLLESRLYDGVPELLGELKENGVKLGLASSKPIAFIETLLDHFQIRSCFADVSGVGFAHVSAPKSEIIRAALRRLDCRRLESAVMVGDRYFDIDGANEAGVDSIGVLYGYGSGGEFAAHGATYTVSHARDIVPLVLE
ncbi:MAG: HAD hydrolase-like protein [Clostridiales bacterium]|nr:HAD hydrolase-like protein [Clostridiales bacterium]